MASEAATSDENPAAVVPSLLSVAESALFAEKFLEAISAEINAAGFIFGWRFHQLMWACLADAANELAALRNDGNVVTQFPRPKAAS